MIHRDGCSERACAVNVMATASDRLVFHAFNAAGLGFTTRPDGHGFGLHSSACAAAELGGALTCHSDAPIAARGSG